MDRLEKINIKSIRSQAKVLGTITTVAGAMMMSLVKGPILLEAFGNKSHNHDNGAVTSQHAIAGGVLISIGCISWACFFNLQVSLLCT